MKIVRRVLTSFVPWHWFFASREGKDFLFLRDETQSMASSHEKNYPNQLLELVNSIVDKDVNFREVRLQSEITVSPEWTSQFVLDEAPVNYSGVASVYHGVEKTLALAVERTWKVQNKMIILIRTDGLEHSSGTWRIWVWRMLLHFIAGQNVTIYLISNEEVSKKLIKALGITGKQIMRLDPVEPDPAFVKTAKTISRMSKQTT